MNSYVKSLRALDVFKRFQTLMLDWWAAEVIFVSKDQTQLEKIRKQDLKNEVVSSLFNNSVFEKHFFESVQEALEENKDQNFIEASWKQAGLDLWILPLNLKGNGVQVSMVVTGALKKDNNKKIKQALDYIGIDDKKMQPMLDQLKVLTETELNHIKQFIISLGEESFSLIQKQFEQKQALTEIQQEKFKSMIGQSDVIKVLYNILEKIKDYKNPLLIQGEAGTGKKLFAQVLHEQSGGDEKNFFIQPCASITSSFFKSHFSNKKEAKEKTFVLDEIANLSKDMQIELLKSLNKGDKNHRIICTTEHNLEDMMTRDEFHPDLFYKINTIVIKMPTLKERGEDIALLANYFLKQKEPFGNKQFSAEVMDVFFKYEWPGHVKELKDEIERILSMTDLSTSIITEDLLSIKLREKGERFFQPDSFKLGHESLKDFLKNIEKQIITNVLKEYKGNKSKAAELLGVSRTSIILKAREYDLLDEAGNF